MTTTVPSTPDGWRKLYSTKFFNDLPYKARKQDSQSEYLERDLLIDATHTFEITRDFLSLFADVTIFTGGVQPVKLGAGGVYLLSTRVISAPSEVTLAFAPASDDDATFTIFATELDVVVKVAIAPAGTAAGSFAGQASQLDFSATSGNVGATITISKNTITISYAKSRDPLEVSSPELARSLQTQLRIADIFFWRNPDLALQLTNYVASATLNSPSGVPLNLQATSIYQQLIANTFAGSRTTFAPLLHIDTYKRTLEGAIAVAAAFEAQYDRFVDRQASVQDQLSAWDTVLTRAQDTAAIQDALLQETESKFNSAFSAVQTATMDYKQHIDILARREADFKVGLKMWQIHEFAKAIFDIASAIMMIAVAVGAAVVAGPAAGAPGAAGLSSVQAAANEFEMMDMGEMTLGQAAKAIMANTTAETANLINLATKAQKLSLNIIRLKMMLEKLLAIVDSTRGLVGTIQGLAKNPLSILPILKQDLSNVANIDSAELTTLAVWDDWRNDVDDSLSFIEGQNIEGAVEYRAELRKHATDGKLLCQLQAQYVKAGQEYAHQLLTSTAAQADLARLQKLRQTYAGEIDTLEQAKALSYDHLMRIRSNITVELRKATWAYRYLSLRDSSVFLDPLKTIDEFRADVSQITSEVENWMENFSSDFASFTPPSIPLSKLLGTTFADSLKLLQDTGSLSFSLTPQPKDSTAVAGAPGPFVGGSHFRISGMRAFLVGIRKLDGGPDAVTVSISSSGLYSDVDESGQILSFQMSPLTRSFKYSLPSISDTLLSNTVWDASAVIIDSFAPSVEHVDPTPFSTWTIKVQNKDALNLVSKLTDVLLMWKGTANFNG